MAAPLLVAGGGIAGLALALTCRQVGLPVRVFEQAPEIRALGVGINLQPHAVRELTEMGLGPGLSRIGIAPTELVYVSKTGRRIWAEPRGLAAGYRWPQYSVHRGELLTLLHAGLEAAGGAGDLVRNARVVAVREDGEGVVATLVSRDGTRREERGALLVGADGIHSAVRAALVPGEGPPRWGGAVLWRATTLARPFLGGRTIAYFGHAAQKFVTYPISAPDPATGLARINWIAERRFDPGAGWNREDWSRRGVLADFLPWFEDWRFDMLDIPALIRGADAVWEYPMVDRDPLPCWRRGRLTLIGDAAHPMYPIGSNGASQAILDVRVLARALLDHGLTEAALAAYEAERRPATARIVLANRANGPDQVLEIVEERTGGVFGDIAEVLSREEMAAMAAEYRRLAGMDVEELNARPPLLGTRG